MKSVTWGPQPTVPYWLIWPIPLVLHVPDMGERYYSVKLTDASTNLNVAYVGTRTTGTQAGDHLVEGRVGPMSESPTIQE